MTRRALGEPLANSNASANTLGQTRFWCTTALSVLKKVSWTSINVMGVGSAVPATAYVLGGPLAPLQIFGPIWRTWRGYHPELVVEEEEFHAAIERVVCVVDGDLIEREPGCVER